MKNRFNHTLAIATLLLALLFTGSVAHAHTSQKIRCFLVDVQNSKNIRQAKVVVDSVEVDIDIDSKGCFECRVANLSSINIAVRGFRPVTFVRSDEDADTYVLPLQKGKQPATLHCHTLSSRNYREAISVVAGKQLNPVVIVDGNSKNSVTIVGQGCLYKNSEHNTEKDFYNVNKYDGNTMYGVAEIILKEAKSADDYTRYSEEPKYEGRSTKHLLRVAERVFKKTISSTIIPYGETLFNITLPIDSTGVAQRAIIREVNTGELGEAIVELIATLGKFTPRVVNNKPVATNIEFVAKFKKYDKSKSETDFDCEVRVKKSPAKFRDGDVTKFHEWVSNNVHYPDELTKLGVQGAVLMAFTVNEYGKVVDMEVVRASNYTIAESRMIALRWAPEWTPAYSNGYAVPTTFVQYFELKLIPVGSKQITSYNKPY